MEFQCASEILPWDSQTDCINIFHPKIKPRDPYWSYFLLRLHRLYFYWQKEFSHLNWGSCDSHFEIRSLFILALDMLWGTTRAINEKSIPSKRKKKGKNKRKYERFVVVCQGRAGIFCLWVSNLNKHFLAVSIEGKKKKKRWNISISCWKST